MLANQLNMVPGEFIWSGGDQHIYSNHVEQVKLQLARKPLTQPTIKFSAGGLDVRDMEYDDIIIEGYESHPSIAAKVAV